MNPVDKTRGLADPVRGTRCGAQRRRRHRCAHHGSQRRAGKRACCRCCCGNVRRNTQRARCRSSALAATAACGAVRRVSLPAVQHDAVVSGDAGRQRPGRAKRAASAVRIQPVACAHHTGILCRGEEEAAAPCAGCTAGGEQRALLLVQQHHVAIEHERKVIVVWKNQLGQQPLPQ